MEFWSIDLARAFHFVLETLEVFPAPHPIFASERTLYGNCEHWDRTERKTTFFSVSGHPCLSQSKRMILPGTKREVDALVPLAVRYSLWLAIGISPVVILSHQLFHFLNWLTICAVGVVAGVYCIVLSGILVRSGGYIWV